MQPASDKAPSSSNALRRWGPLALIVVILFGIALAITLAAGGDDDDNAASSATTTAKSDKVGAPEPTGRMPVTYLEAMYEGKPTPAWLHTVKEWENVLYAILAALILILLFGSAAKPKALIPGPAQNAAEALLGGLHDFFLGVLGPSGKPYVPFVGSLMLYIVTMNWMGMVPFLKSPSTSLNTTFALALCVFVYVQYIGITRNGLAGYLYHFAGQPKDAIGWGSAILLFPLEVMGEFIKPISLSCRLFGNILGEHTATGIFMGMLPFVLPWPMMGLGIFGAFLQTFVFIMLTMVYIGGAVAAEEH